MAEWYQAMGRIDFEVAVNALTNDLMKYGSRVVEPPHQMTHLRVDQRWTSIELTNVLFQYSIPDRSTDLAVEIRPNLPWAEDHFRERVSGIPHNPPPSHSSWPYARSDNEEHMALVQPELDHRQWAYLAAFLDGEGCITMRGKRPAIQFSQKDHEFLQQLATDTGAGKTYIRPPRTTGVGVLSQPCVWHIASTQEMVWFLEGVIPYLRLKKSKAEEALSVLKDRDPHHAIKEFGERGTPRFSHTYPERMWHRDLHGLRCRYGDLHDVVNLLARSPYTRQAFLPIFWPEDTGNVQSVRTPCTLGYHFLAREGKLNLFYPMRSCDLVRFFRDDVYMACRLCQWIVSRIHEHHSPIDPGLKPGTLTMHIVSLHCFEGDLPQLRRQRQGVLHEDH